MATKFEIRTDSHEIRLDNRHPITLTADQVFEDYRMSSCQDSHIRESYDTLEEAQAEFRAHWANWGSTRRMKDGFEIYTNNGGGITLYIISDGRPVAAFPGLEQLLNYSSGGDTLRSMIGQLYADPTAYEDWDGAWDGDVEALYEFDANPDRDHDLSELGLTGEYDARWRCTVTVSAGPMSGLIELLGWDLNDR